MALTELANTMKCGEGVLYNFVFTEFQFKTVSGDVTAFHKICLFHNVLHMVASHRYLTDTQRYMSLIKGPGLVYWLLTFSFLSLL